MRVFVGGSTGATGRCFVPAAVAAGLDLVVHVRPQSAAKYAAQQAAGPPPAVFDLDDTAALTAAVDGCAVVLSMIGTMAKRFGSGDTYAASDVGTTRTLVEAARSSGVGHFVLLGALGTARGPGAYYQAKRDAEAIVLGSGLGWTMVRPSMLVGNGRGPSAALAFNHLRAVPGLAGVVDDWGPISVEVLARALVAVVSNPDLHHGKVLFGRTLWALGGSDGVPGGRAPVEDG